MTKPKLIKTDGRPFEAGELKSIYTALDALDTAGRQSLADDNATQIAAHAAPRMLVVSGPGTGKSYLFLGRISKWLKEHKEDTVLVTTFVRKLLTDLQKRLSPETTRHITEEESRRVSLLTIHSLARSIVERNHGCSERGFARHIRMITPEWQPVVWADVMEFHASIDRKAHRWQDLERQFHEDCFVATSNWQQLRDTYFRLTGFYNALNFCDTIVMARQALQENGDLSSDRLFIVDEYQDLNQSEERLVRELTKRARAILFVGDDDQVLYERLKGGRAEFIQGLYGDQDVVNAMLPFSRRGGFHITKAAAAFMEKHRDGKAIPKVYLPIRDKPSEDSLVHLIGCAHPASAVDYVAGFLQAHKERIERRVRDLDEGRADESYLLVLTPDRDASFLGKKYQKELAALIERYKRSDPAEPSDYFRLLEYQEVTKRPSDNFALRKLLHYHGVKVATVHKLLNEALASNRNLCDLDDDEIERVLEVARRVSAMLESDDDPGRKVKALLELDLGIENLGELAKYLASRVTQDIEVELEEMEEKAAEAAGHGVRRLSAVEQMTIVSSKGLSADHVIVLGCDNINMNYVTKNACFVALTRARDSVHLVCSLKTGGSLAPHDLLQSLPEAHVRYAWYRKADRSMEDLGGWKRFCGRIQYIDQMGRKKPQAR